MGRSIIKIKDKYFEWSTIVDAPVTYGMDKEELEQYISCEYGQEGLKKLTERLTRVEESGSSMYGEDLESTIMLNRAGDKEKTLTRDEIYYKFVLKEDDSNE